MQRNFTEIFYGPADTQWAKAAPGGGAPRGAQPTKARPVGLCPPLVPPDRLFALLIPQYSRNPRGVDENQFQPPQSPESPDPI